MPEEDQEKMSFIIDKGIYYYKVIPFELKNARATYQRLVNRMFETQIGRNVEVYIDDMLVKSLEAEKHLDDLKETLGTLGKYQMKLNFAKCAFGVSAGKFLDFIVSHKGIEANPEKVKAILDLKPSHTTKEVQQLPERVAALSRFISRSTDKCFPFFRLLKKAFEWTEECDQAFRGLKEHLASLPCLSRMIPGDDLYLYLAVSEVAVSFVLI